MSLSATIQIGRIRYTVTADTDRRLFEQVSLFAEMPDRCGNATCNSTNIIPRHRSPHGNDYYSLVCADCGHEYTYGITKEDKKLFPHRKWEPPYQPGASREQDYDPPRRDSGRVPTQPRNDYDQRR